MVSKKDSTVKTKESKTGLKSFLGGFVHAFNGIIASIKSERNLRFHLIAMIYVFIFSLFYDFSKIEYILLVIVCGLVIFSEIINTAIESICDGITLEYDEHIKLAKDAGAGAVLILAITSVIVGVVLFLDLEIITSVFIYFFNNKIVFAIFLISILLSIIFIRGKKSWRKA